MSIQVDLIADEDGVEVYVNTSEATCRIERDDDPYTAVVKVLSLLQIPYTESDRDEE